jgi:hypothetical protein
MVHSSIGKSPLNAPQAATARTGGARQSIEIDWATSQHTRWEETPMLEHQIGRIAAIIIGGIAGWLAEQFMKSQMGPVALALATTNIPAQSRVRRRSPTQWN